MGFRAAFLTVPREGIGSVALLIADVAFSLPTRDPNQGTWEAT